MAPRTATTPDKRQLDARANPWCLRILIAILVGTPLATLPVRFAGHDTTPKIAILYLGSASFLWLAALSWSAVVALWRTPVGRSFYLLLILGAASLLNSSAFSGDPWLSFAGTLWRRVGALIQLPIFFITALMAAHAYLDRGIARKLLLGMEAAGGIASIYAILQYAGFDPLIPAYLYTAGPPPAVVRPPATLGNATYFATFLLPAILIAASFRLRQTAAGPRRLHEIIFFVSLAALILSGTRSAVLGLAAGMCVLIFLCRGRLLGRETLMRAGYRALALAVLAAVFLLLPAGAGLRVRLAQWVGDRAGGPRLMVWRDSLLLFEQHSVLGIGPEMFEAEFPKAESLELARAFPDNYHESPHNFFFEVGLAQGAVGVAVWVGLLGLGCWCGASRGRVDFDAATLSAALLAMLLSLQFCPLTITSELYVLAMLAMLVGLAAVPVSQRFRIMALPWAAMQLARATSVVLLVIGAVYMAQDILYALAENRIANEDLGGAERWYELVRKFPVPGPNLEFSRQLASLARRSSQPLRDDALAAAKRASATAELGSAERSQALYQSAMLAILSGDFRTAESKLRAAIDAAPNWYRPRMALASVLWATARNQQAEQEAAIALKCAGRMEGFVKRTLDDAQAQANARATTHARVSAYNASVTGVSNTVQRSK